MSHVCKQWGRRPGLPTRPGKPILFSAKDANQAKQKSPIQNPVKITKEKESGERKRERLRLCRDQEGRDRVGQRDRQTGVGGVSGIPSQKAQGVTCNADARRCVHS